MRRTLLVNIGAFGTLLILGALIHVFFFKIPGFILVGLLISIVANFLTFSIQTVSPALKRSFASRESQANSILNSVYEGLAEIDSHPSDLGRFQYSYEHVIYSPIIMQNVTDFIERNHGPLLQADVDRISAQEAALLALYANYSPSVAKFLDSKFKDLAIPEFTKLADKAATNQNFQKIVLVLSLGNYFFGRATSFVDKIYATNFKSFYGERHPRANDSFQQKALHASNDEIIVTYLVGNVYEPLKIFSKIERQMKGIHFYFIHPCILSRQGLLALQAELEAPELIKQEVGFLHSPSGNYDVDFVRKVFQILSNINEVVQLMKLKPHQNTRLFFFHTENPLSLCASHKRNGLPFLDTGRD